MKKLLTLLSVALLPSVPSFAGTNAAVTVNTNNYSVSPTNLWRSNSTLLIDALTNAGFTGGSGGSTLNPFTLVDPRPYTNYDQKNLSDATGPVPPGGESTYFVLFTNVGQGTITDLGLDIVGLSDQATTTNEDLYFPIYFIIDGITNMIRAGAFSCAWGGPTNFFTDRITLNDPWNNNDVGPTPCLGFVRHKLEINFYTNCEIILWSTNDPDNDVNVDVDVGYRIGAPISLPNHRYWHCFDTNATNNAGTVMTILNITNCGDVESLFFTALNTNLASYPYEEVDYLEYPPYFYCDGTNVTHYRGFESVFDGTVYFHGQRFYTSISGNSVTDPTYGAKQLSYWSPPGYPTNTGATSSYRFWNQQITFNSTLKLVWTNNVFGVGASNIQTWWSGSYFTTNNSTNH